MSDTPRTEAEWQSITVSAPWDAAADQMAQHARQLERELAGAHERCTELEADLADQVKQHGDTIRDYRCLASLLDGHDATECRANLEKLQADLAAERALADKLAEALNESTEGFGDRMSCEESCQCAGRRIVKVNKEAISAWKETRCGIC